MRVAEIDGKLWSPEDVARYFDVPVSTIYGWRHKGVGPPGIRVGRHVRYRPTDVDEWLRRQESESGRRP